MRGMGLKFRRWYVVVSRPLSRPSIISRPIDGVFSTHTYFKYSYRGYLPSTYAPFVHRTYIRVRAIRDITLTVGVKRLLKVQQFTSQLAIAEIVIKHNLKNCSSQLYCKSDPAWLNLAHKNITVKITAVSKFEIGKLQLVFLKILSVTAIRSVFQDQVTQLYSYVQIWPWACVMYIS